jgi:hypothetical protein
MICFESHKIAGEKDKKVIFKIENGDAQGLDETLR